MQARGPAILQGEHGFAGFVRRPRRKPCIAAVNGPAIAGGFEVMLACDLAIGEEHAFFSFPETQIGLTAAAVDWCGCRVASRRRSLSGCCSPVSRALDMAERIVAASPQSIRSSLYLAKLAQGSEDAAWNACNALWEAMSDSHDALEGPRALVERRVPAWTS